MWRIVPGQTLCSRGWDNEFVLYNDLSGDTHLLGASAIRLLTVLQQAAATENELTASLSVSQPSEADSEAGNETDEQASAELLEQTRKILADLEALALIEPCGTA